MNNKEALLFLATTPMRPMTPVERLGFQGCSQSQPLIGENDDGPTLLVLDASILSVFQGEDVEKGRETARFDLTVRRIL